MRTANSSPTGGVYDWSWFARGMTGLFSIPALILISAFVGFGGLAREAGISLGQLVFMVPTIWALPSHLILISGIVAGAALPAIAAAVALAAIRLLPMTMALIPEIRAPGSRTWHLLVVSNMIAVTAWVHALLRVGSIPRPGRLPYFCGFATVLMVATTLVAAIVHQLAAAFPPFVMAGLYFLTPLYFAISTWRTARVRAEQLALALGFCLSPAFFLILPEANILAAGIAAGLIAFLIHQFLRRSGAGQ